MTDILRKGRFNADMDKDVKSFLQSIDADRWLFDADLLVDRVHVIMLAEQEIISDDDASGILDALDKIIAEGVDSIRLDEFEDVHEAIESKVIELVGEDVGGRMHTARSRNDEVATCIRIKLRWDLLMLMGKTNKLCSALLELAEKHTDTIMPGLTHLQHAQPTTLAHHLVAHVDAFSRDFDRLMDCLARVNMCPLGGGALTSTGFPIDRQRVADLLGFDSILENSMDAVSTRDFAIEAMSCISLLMNDLSRLSSELILWSTPEFDFIELDDAYASTSSIMPQKKNPDAAELIRARAGSMHGHLIAGLIICRALQYSYSRDLQEVTPHVMRSAEIALSSVKLMKGMIETMKINTDSMKQKAGIGFMQATELADTLVRINMPFRTAHQIVSVLARKGIEKPSIEDLDEISIEITGNKLSEMGLSSEQVENALDLWANIELKKGVGGPAPSEVKRMIDAGKDKLKANMKLVEDKESKLDAVREKLVEKR